MLEPVVAIEPVVAVPVVTVVVGADEVDALVLPPVPPVPVVFLLEHAARAKRANEEAPRRKVMDRITASIVSVSPHRRKRTIAPRNRFACYHTAMQIRRAVILLVSFVLACLAVACTNPPVAPHVASSSSSALPAQEKHPTDPLDAPLPLDARVRKGTLPSGLTYYVLAHKKPEKRAQMYLVVNAGSVLEDDDQRGLAHLCEHMAFDGTTRFPKQTIINFLEKAGVRFGADLNAYTNFDETVYTLQVPTDQPELLNTTIQILKDWSDSVTFDPKELERERDVVLEEWRLGRGAQMRVLDKQAPVVFQGSKYADRITIGKPDIIKNAPRDTVMRFYKDWYRPDLMAVVAVGDFDAADVEAKIKAEFGSQAKPTSPRPRPKVEMPKGGETRVTIETDPELTATSVAIMNEVPHRGEATSRDYRRSIAEQLYSQMLNARLDELRRDPDPPFLAGSVGSRVLVRTEDVFSQAAVVKEDGIERGASGLLEEVLRVERHGFAPTELDRAKASVLRFFQEAVAEREKSNSVSLAREIVRNFLNDEAMPGIEAELDLVKQLLPTISVDELNQIAKSFAGASRVITVSGPPTIVKPSTEGMLALIKDVNARDIAAYVDAVPTEPLMKSPPAKGSVSSEKKIPELGVTEWTLSNGVRVVVKPTDFANDSIQMLAFAPGGTSLASDADFGSARFAADVMRIGGIGPYDAVQLRKAMAGKVVGIEPFIGELDQGLRGHSTKADLETLFQLANLSFTAPRKDTKAIEAWRKREMEALKDVKLSPDRVFSDEMLGFTTQNHPRRQPMTADTYAKIDADKAMAFYMSRFADASGFTFVIVGNVDVDALKGLTEQYLASLPAAKHKEKWKDPKVNFPRGAATKIVEKGTEPKATVRMIFHGTEPWSRETENDMDMLADALRHRLLQVLRIDMGRVYGVSVGGSVSRIPHPEDALSIRFGCAPENVDQLQKAVLDEIASIQKDGVDAETVGKMKEARKRGRELELKENEFWLESLGHAYELGDDPKVILDFDPWVEKITSDRIKQAAKKFAQKTELLVGVLRPEK